MICAYNLVCILGHVVRAFTTTAQTSSNETLVGNCNLSKVYLTKVIVLMRRIERFCHANRVPVLKTKQHSRWTGGSYYRMPVLLPCPCDNRDLTF